MNKVTIIMPAYNAEQYIVNAISSIINQTYKNWELIIIDDKSTDKTINIIRKYIQSTDNKYNIILHENKKNVGPYVCMNLGILMSSGDIIMRIDSDDEYDITKLEKQVKILSTKNVLACTCKYKKRNETRYGEICLAYRKQVIEKIGYYDSVRICADTEFMHRLLKTGIKIEFMDDVLYYYNIRENSLTTNIDTGTRSNNGLIARKLYVRSFIKWHNMCDKLYVDFDKDNLNIRAPFIIPNGAVFQP